MKYFFDPFTLQSVEKQFKLLSKYLHPDKPGGSEAEFKEMLEEKEKCIELVKQFEVKRKIFIEQQKRNLKSHTVRKDVKVFVNFNSVANLLKEIRKF
jgi:hypothetical protein